MFFHVTCKISNFNMWTTKHLAQASCTELTLLRSLWGDPFEYLLGHKLNKWTRVCLLQIFQALLCVKVSAAQKYLLTCFLYVWDLLEMNHKRDMTPSITSFGLCIFMHWIGLNITWRLIVWWNKYRTIHFYLMWTLFFRTKIVFT